MLKAGGMEPPIKCDVLLAGLGGYRGLKGSGFASGSQGLGCEPSRLCAFRAWAVGLRYQARDALASVIHFPVGPGKS